MHRPIDFEDASFEEPWRPWREQLGGFKGWMGWAFVALIIAIWLVTGVYSIGPSEVGLVKQFGRFVQTAEPGVHYHWPAPIQSVSIVDRQSVRTEEIGFRSQAGLPSTQYPVQEEEALMLTGDFNIIRVETVVQYDVTQAETFAFELQDYRTMIRETAQAIIREQIATRGVDEALTEAREQIADSVHQELQKLLDQYGTGIRILNVRLQEVAPPTPQVAEAFDDVNSAVQDKERTIFDAQKYSNEQIPRAQGQAQQINNEALAYKQTRVLGSQGDVARFLAVLGPYQQARAVTEARLYIETMESVLPQVNKIILPAGAGSTLNFLDLQQLLQSSAMGGGS